MVAGADLELGQFDHGDCERGVSGMEYCKEDSDSKSDENDEDDQDKN